MTTKNPRSRLDIRMARNEITQLRALAELAGVTILEFLAVVAVLKMDIKRSRNAEKKAKR